MSANSILQSSRALAIIGLLFPMLASSCTTIPHSPEDVDVDATPGSARESQGGVSPRPLALVYRGPASCAGCAEAVAVMLKSSSGNFDVRYVGPDEALKLSAATLKRAALYAQPGGDGSLSEAYDRMSRSSDIIRDYVKGGGRYIGICMGGYLAGSSPGFGILPGDADQFITSPQASVVTDADTIVQINWGGRSRSMYFQDGPYFKVRRSIAGVTVLATYTNGQIAALVAPCGKGKVAVCGPHPEADARWYEHHQLVNPNGVDAEAGRELIESLMQ
jgi:glutamine amidotransferase-like uncharacterized protein